MDHPIFHTPHAVQLTLEERPTPSSYARYPEGHDLGPTMPMWRVQTEGYLEGQGQLVGVVSRDEGFGDSPDVEWISGGVNSKGPNAVAIGRHGNFLHWGFAASPRYMTDEAKLVFVNGIHHIAGFDGQVPVARKVQGTLMRTAIERYLEDISDEGYARVQARYEQIRAEEAARKDAVRARIEAGEDVPEAERRVLEYPPAETPARFKYIERFFGAELVDRLERDPEQVAAYLRANLGYMRSHDWYAIEIDQDARAFGFANNDLGMIVRAVKKLEAGQDVDLATTLLERYTTESFGSAAEWSAWLETNRDHLFFAESAGYKWLVNVPGARAAEAAARRPMLKPTEKDPVAMDLSIEALEDGRRRLTVHVAVLDGWHAYGVAPPTSPYQALQLELDLPEGVTLDGTWERPVGHPDPDSPGLTVLEGSFTCSCLLRGGAPDARVRCEVSYQVCDDRMCLPPTTEDLSSSLGD